MKPTPQITSENAFRSFPLTDYSFQSTQEAPAISAGVLPMDNLRAFRKVSGDYFAAETRIDYVAESFLFLLIAGIAAWPILSMLGCLATVNMIY